MFYYSPTTLLRCHYSLHYVLYYDVTNLCYYDVTNLRYYDVTNPSTMTSLTPLL